jgi:hypothetical protein
LAELDGVIEFSKQHAAHEDELYAPTMATVDAEAGWLYARQTDYT